MTEDDENLYNQFVGEATFDVAPKFNGELDISCNIEYNDFLGYSTWIRRIVVKNGKAKVYIDTDCVVDSFNTKEWECFLAEMEYDYDEKVVFGSDGIKFALKSINSIEPL